MKKLILLLVLLTLALTSCQQMGQTSLKDGSYQGTEQGYGGPLTVEVTVKDQAIESVSLKDHHETSPVSNRAMPLLEERIKEAQSPVIDSVTGATFTSYAVKKAVASALQQAGAQPVEITMATEKAPATEDKKLDDVTTDLLVIGGGPSGLAAAIEAKNQGVDKMILVEKLDILSGNGKFDMNFFDLINSKAMKDNDNEVTKEEFIASKSHAVDSEERKKVWAEGSWDLDEWLRSMDIHLDYNFGGKGGTSHLARTDAYAGEEVQDGLERKAKELNLDIRTGTKATELLIEDNQVMGAKVTTKYGSYTIHANHVIIATGGFSNNKELLKKYAPEGADQLATSNQMGTTGDLIGEFEKHNLKLDHMDILSVFATILNPRKDLTGNSKGFIVNKQGKRFLDASKTSLERGLDIKNQEDGAAFLIYDQENYESFYRLKKHVALGYHTKADSLEDLAKALGIDPQGLVETIQAYNQMVKDQSEDSYKDMPFGKTPRLFNETGPYYGAKVESAIHMTKGGLVANENAQVLTNDNQIVKGLYASGEVTDTTGAYSASVVWGRVAGQQAAQDLKH